MTTGASKKKASGARLPDPPRRELDEVTAFDYLHKPGTSHHLVQHFGNPETTLVETDRWVVATAGDNKARGRVPDLLVAFGVDPEKYRNSNGYIVSEQGKPPDFVLEVASESTAATDTGAKRRDYEALGIPEYWRFDHTGESHGTRLAGDQLVNGRYEPVLVETVAEGILQGFSNALNLYLRWEDGELVFVDPSTNSPILTYQDQKARADSEATRAENEAALRQQAEEKNQQLEEEIRRLRGR